MSPDPAVARTVAVGIVCEVLIEGSPPQLRLYLRDEGALLGAITERWSDLTGCINAGFAFEAEVIHVAPAIRVRVRLRRPYTLRLPVTVAITDMVPGVGVYAGDVHRVVRTHTGRVIVQDGNGSQIGIIAAEPVALPDALRAGNRISATVTDADSPAAVLGWA